MRWDAVTGRTLESAEEVPVLLSEDSTASGPPLRCCQGATITTPWECVQHKFVAGPSVPWQAETTRVMRRGWIRPLSVWQSANGEPMTAPSKGSDACVRVLPPIRLPVALHPYMDRERWLRSPKRQQNNSQDRQISPKVKTRFNTHSDRSRASAKITKSTTKQLLTSFTAQDHQRAARPCGARSNLNFTTNDLHLHSYSTILINHIFPLTYFTKAAM